MQAYGLTHEEVARQISASSLDLPGGGIKQIMEKFWFVWQIERKLLRNMRTLSFDPPLLEMNFVWVNWGEIIDGYADNDQSSYYNGKPAVRLVVYRVGAETPIAVAEATKEYLDNFRITTPTKC